MRKSNFDGNNFQFFEDILRKKRSHAEEGLSLLERGEIEYIKSGLYQKICSIPAQDALKNGYEICDSNEDILEDENTKKINNILYDFDVDAKITEAMTYSRAMGGSVILLLLDDGEDIENPINEKQLKKVLGIKVYNATEVTPFSYDEDITSERYKEIEKYTITSERTGTTFRVHYSRLLIFDGLDAIGRVRSLRNGWGGMVYDNIKNELMRYERANSLSISILSRISQGVLKISKLRETVSKFGKKEITQYLNYTDMMRSVMNSILIDGEDSFELKNMTLAGYKEIIEQQEVALSAVTQIPITILFGRSPAGMNSTGDADLEIYYSLVKRIQTNDIQKNLETFINIIAKCKEYKVKEDSYHIKFNEIKMLDEKDKAEIENKKADSLVKIANAVETLHELGAIDNDEIAEYLDTRTDFPINHNYGGGKE